MAQRNYSFGVALICGDGRANDAVTAYMRKRFGVFTDRHTASGLDKLLSESDEQLSQRMAIARNEVMLYAKFFELRNDIFCIGLAVGSLGEPMENRNFGCMPILYITPMNPS